MESIADERMSNDEQNISSTTDPISVLTISPHGAVPVELGDMKPPDMVEDEEPMVVGSTSLLSNQGFLGVVSPTLTNPTLQGLLSSPTVLQGAQLGLPQGVQIVTVSSPSDILPHQSVNMDGQVWHVISPEQAIITVGDVGELKPGALIAGPGMEEQDAVSSTELVGSAQDIASVLMPPPATPLPPGCPALASRYGRVGWSKQYRACRISPGYSQCINATPCYTPPTWMSGMEESDAVSSTELAGSAQDIASVLMPPPATPLPPGCPAWAARMKNCEKIGNYYRGYVDTEVELDILLTYHKQATQSFWGTLHSTNQKIGNYYRGYVDTEAELDILLTYHKQATQSFWGTRQSPSPAKMSSRLMWKSQYVPYDGIPFVNSGSRAIVQECQFGPRRKGTLAKKQNEHNASGDYKQTCPARIYIKKVRKFPEYKVDPNLDKKNTKAAMDKAFHGLKQANVEKCGQERYYVQLPLNSAHEFHDTPAQVLVNETTATAATQTIIHPPEPEQVKMEEEKTNRLNPLVANKIREIVAGGETRVYQVRRLLRAFVCREVYSGSADSVQRHDLSLFPTVTDLKNHIHQAVKDIQTGSLPLTAPMVNVEAMAAQGEDQIQDLNVWPQNLVGSGPVPETVTVTLTQGPGEDGGHVISRIETHLSDGSTQISTSLTPETAQLLARLNPAMFPPGSLVQLQAANQQPSLNGEEKFDPNYNMIEIGEQESSQFTENLSIQTTDVNTLPIPVLGSGAVEATDLLSKEGTGITEQTNEIIMLTDETSPFTLIENS